MTTPDAPEPGNPGGAVAHETRCYRHPNREALIRCTRCDRPICPECMRPASVGFHCPDDVNLARKTVRAPRTAVGARILEAPPYVTIALIAANLTAYFVTASQAVGGLRQPGDGSSKLFNEWQLQPLAVHAHDDYYRLITSAFLHISLLHILTNMVSLAVIGPPLERLLGRWRFGVLYLLGALGGSAAIYAWGKVLTPVVGASGALYGLMAAALMLVLAGKLNLDLQWLIGVIVLNFVLTFSIHNISKLGHAGGFVIGGLAAVAIAGLPGNRERVATQTQVVGLCGVAAIVLAVVVLRSATF
jgi:membrane associated rhomboid family serine protease